MKFQRSFLIVILFKESLIVGCYYSPARFQPGPRQNLPERKPKAKEENPDSLHEYFLSSKPKSKKFDKLQAKLEAAAKLLAKRFGLTPTQLKDDHICEIPIDTSKCNDNEKFRTLDGSCNNLRNPSWGMSTSCYQRFLAPEYADGISAKRIAKSGKHLPSPRKVSLIIHPHYDAPARDVNHLFMVWGQFLDHDIALTPLTSGPDDKPIKCCPLRKDNHESCDPILVGKDDPFYGKLGITCLNNVRSAKCLTCTYGPREQINQVTAYIDASQVYGNSVEESRLLRNNDGSGVMKYVKIPGAGELPPGSNFPEHDECSFQDDTYDCFQTGDLRANQHPGLISLHTIFLREHNRIARILRKMNPSWSGERIFHESRRIVGAEMQMITYNEFLPLVIGPDNMARYELNVRPEEGYTTYDEDLEGALATEFSTAAFRFGHSMINSYFRDSTNKGKGFFLRDIFNNPYGLYKGQLDGVVKGMTESPSQKCDRFLVPDVTNHLFQTRGNKSGLDLAALNVNRGRDHGVPGYTALLKFCDGPKITNWVDLSNIFGYIWIYRFRKLYDHVDDIDLFSGGLAEKPDEGAVVGPTFACIIGQQFNSLKYGDRFYFEHGGQSGSFTPDQLKEIKKVSLGRIICDNSIIQELQKNIFFNPDYENEMELCEGKPKMNLNPWKE